MNIHLEQAEQQYPTVWREILRQVRECETSGNYTCVVFQADVRDNKLIAIAQTDLVMDGSNRGMVIQFEARLPVSLRVV